VLRGMNFGCQFDPLGRCHFSELGRGKEGVGTRLVGWNPGIRLRESRRSGHALRRGLHESLRGLLTSLRGLLTSLRGKGYARCRGVRRGWCAGRRRISHRVGIGALGLRRGARFAPVVLDRGGIGISSFGRADRNVAMQADLRIAAVDSEFGIPAAKLSIAYAPDSVKRLIDLVGPAHARMILYTARRIDAVEAEGRRLLTAFDSRSSKAEDIERRPLIYSELHPAHFFDTWTSTERN